MAGDASGFAASRENSAGVERNRRRLRARSRNPALRPPPQTPSGGTPAPTAPGPTRFEHAPGGRQTPAKRKYVEDRRLGEWRRGGIEPPSEGSNRGLPECPGVAKHAESQRWRVRHAPRVTHGFQKIRNVSGTCGGSQLHEV